MAIILHQNLFTWDQIDTTSDLARLDLVLSNLPDEEIVKELERRRGAGRDTYPVRPNLECHACRDHLRPPHR